MKMTEYLAPLLGSWQAVNRLRMLPTDDYQDSAASAIVRQTAGDFVTIAYTWSEGGKPQDGLLLLGGTSDAEGPTAVWVDSWHTAPGWLKLSGSVGENSVLRLTGSYPAPPGPDWGWQIHLEPGNGRITMHNAVPGEEAYQVVELAFEGPR